MPQACLAIAVAAKFEARKKWGEAIRLVLQEWDDWAAKNVPPSQVMLPNGQKNLVTRDCRGEAVGFATLRKAAVRQLAVLFLPLDMA